MKFTSAVSALVAAAAFVTVPTATTALELTPENFDSETAGKVVFLKMFAPCKSWRGETKSDTFCF